MKYLKTEQQKHPVYNYSVYIFERVLSIFQNLRARLTREKSYSTSEINHTIQPINNEPDSISIDASTLMKIQYLYNLKNIHITLSEGGQTDFIRLVETSQSDDFRKRLEYLETVYEHAVRPTLAALAKQAWHEKDTLPAASSAKYELIAKLIQMNEAAKNIIVHYTDLDERLQAYVDLLTQLKNVLQYARNVSNRYFYQAILMIHDALSCIFSEELTKEQANAVWNAVASLQEQDWNKEKLRSLDKYLRSSGLETVLSDKFHVQEENKRATLS